MKTIRVKVKPQSRESSLTEAADGTWIARVKAQPVDGKANAELAELVAGRFGVRRAQVVIKSGAGARLKLVQVDA